MNSSTFVIIVSILLVVIIAICVFHTIMIYSIKKIQDARYRYCKKQISRLMSDSEKLDNNIAAHNRRIHILELEDKVEQGKAI